MKTVLLLPLDRFHSPLITLFADQSEAFSFVLKHGDNYGSRYGVYFGSGNRNGAIYSGTRMCYSGHEHDWDNIRPDDGIIVKYMCGV